MKAGEFMLLLTMLCVGVAHGALVYYFHHEGAKLPAWTNWPFTIACYGMVYAVAAIATITGLSLLKDLIQWFAKSPKP